MKITKDGMYRMTSGHVGDRDDESIIYVSGNAGGATVKLVFKDEAGNDVDLIDGNMEVGGQYHIVHGTGVNIMFKVTGSSVDTLLYIKVAGVN